MGKPTICICETKGADQLRGYSFAVTAKLISAFVFATQIVHFLFFLNPKFQASSLLLCLYSSVCVRPGQKPHCWFSHETAQVLLHAPTEPLCDIYLSHRMEKPKPKNAWTKTKAQINCEADQRLCFRYTDSTIHLLLKSEISSF